MPGRMPRGVAEGLREDAAKDDVGVPAAVRRHGLDRYLRVLKELARPLEAFLVNRLENGHSRRPLELDFGQATRTAEDLRHF